MTLSGVYIGNSPADLTAYENWLGSEVDFVRAHGGRANWNDFTGSLGWLGGQFAGTGREIYWSVPMIVNGATLAAGATGAYDSYYVKAAQTILKVDPNAESIHIRLGEEFNASWMPWAAAGKETAFIETFRHFVDAFRSVSDKFVFEWNVNIGDFGMNPEKAYPGDNYVDIIGMDFYYNNNWDPKDPLQAWNSMVTRKYGLQWLENFAAAHGKPTAYSEWGINSDNAGAYVKAAYEWFASHNVLYQSYWNSDADFAGKLSNGALAGTGAVFREMFGGVTGEDGAYSVDAGRTLTVSAANGLLEGHVAPFALTGGPAHGMLTVSADGSFVYTPDAGFSGEDGFRWALLAHPDKALDVSLTVAGARPTMTAPAFTGLTGTWRGGTSGADTVVGGDGSDLVDGRGGRDTLIGGRGDDRYTVDSADDTIVEAAGEGVDTVHSYSSSYVLGANVEHLRLVAAYGQRGVGNALDNRIEAGAMNDVIEGARGNDWLTGGAGADVFVYRWGDGHDVITDFTPSGAGADRIELASIGVSSFAELMTGAIDTAAGVVLWLPDGGSILLQGVTGSQLSAANFSFAGRDAPAVSTAETTTLAFGTTAAETIAGTAGADYIDGKGGADTLRGEAGDDQYIVRGMEKISEAYGGGIDMVRSLAASYELALNVEHLYLVGTGGQTGIGNGLENRIVGSAGADRIDGRAGNDWLTGGDGRDVFKFGVGAGNDVITDFAGGRNGDILDLSAFGFSGFTRVMTAMAETDGGVSLSLGNGSTVLLLGTSLGDFSGENVRLGTLVGPAIAQRGWETLIEGTDRADALTGDDRNNSLDGGAGIDTLTGGRGDDMYAVDRTEDIVVERAGEGVDSVTSTAATYTLGANIEHLRLAGSSGQFGIGNSLDNRITSGFGADTIEGGGGNDWLTGGSARDVFVFRAGSGHDVITDFQVAGTADAIDLRGMGLTFAAVKAGMETTAAGTVLDLPDGGTITLLDVAGASLTSSHFLF